MRDTILKLVQNPGVTKIIFIHNKNYEYSFEQVSKLIEVANCFTKLTKQKEIFKTSVIENTERREVKTFFDRYSFFTKFVNKRFSIRSNWCLCKN